MIVWSSSFVMMTRNQSIKSKLQPPFHETPDLFFCKEAADGSSLRKRMREDEREDEEEERRGRGGEDEEEDDTEKKRMKLPEREAMAKLDPEEAKRSSEREIRDDYKSKHGGSVPTDEEIVTERADNYDDDERERRMTRL